LKGTNLKTKKKELDKIAKLAKTLIRKKKQLIQAKKLDAREQELAQLLDQVSL
jgi:hypothetical protein